MCYELFYPLFNIISFDVIGMEDIFSHIFGHGGGGGGGFESMFGK